MKKNPDQTYILLAAVFILILISSFTFFSKLERLWGQPEDLVVAKVVYEKPVIQSKTVVEQEIVYLCGDRMVSTIPTTKDLVGLDYEGLLAKFPSDQGWKVDDSNPNVITLSRLENDICGLHDGYNHFGIYKDQLAIYKGPLGYNQIVEKIEDILIKDLPIEFQDDLKLSEQFREQPLEVKNRLRNQLEFANEKELSEALLRIWEELDELI